MEQYKFISADDGNVYFLQLEDDDDYIGPEPVEYANYKSTMYFWANYSVGDSYNGWESNYGDFLANHESRLNEDCYWYPLFLCEGYNGDLSIDFSDNYANGIIFIDKEGLSEEEAYEEVLREVCDYNTWLEGSQFAAIFSLEPNCSIEDVFIGDSFYHQDELDCIDSCGGFYGDDETRILNYMGWNVSSIECIY